MEHGVRDGVRARKNRNDIRREIVSIIVREKLRRNDRLPSERDLSVRFGASHLTVRAALGELVEAGVVARIPWRGSFYTGVSLEGLMGEGAPAYAHAVGIVLRDDPHFFYPLRDQICRKLAENDQVLIQCPSPTDNDSLEFSLHFLRMRRIRHLIVQRRALEKSPGAIRMLQEDHGFSRIIQVFGNRHFPKPLPGIHFLGDYGAAYRQAIDYFQRRGHQRIGFLCESCAPDHPDGAYHREFLRLYQAEMRQAGLARFATHCVPNAPDAVSDDPLRAWIRSATRPTAVIGSTDSNCVRLMDVALSVGLTVPDDLALVGFYDTPWRERYRFPSFRFPCETVAADILDVIRGDPGPETVRPYPFEFVGG